MRFIFADCSLDTDSYVFTRNGQPQSLEPQVFDLLSLLVENAGRLITRDELIERVWDGRIVSEATISSRINAARNAVGDSGKVQAVIRTIPRRGIEFVARVDRPGDGPAPPAATSPQTIRYATSADGTMIAWATSGDGTPLLYAASHVTHLELDWASPLRRPLLDALGADHRLIRFDIRGTGLSDNGAEDTIDSHVADLAAVADAAGLDRFPILANLNSACAAIRFAAQNPERVSHLVIQQGYARGRALRGTNPSAPQADPFVLLLQGGGWGDPDSGFMRAWLSMAAPGLDTKELNALIRLVGGVCTIEQAIESRRVIDRFDVRADLAQVLTPTLVMHNRNCSLHPISEGRMLAAGIPGAEFLVLDSANTLCHPKDPTFAQQIRAILDFVAPDRAN